MLALVSHKVSNLLWQSTRGPGFGGICEKDVIFCTRTSFHINSSNPYIPRWKPEWSRLRQPRIEIRGLTVFLRVRDFDASSRKIILTIPQDTIRRQSYSHNLAQSIEQSFRFYHDRIPNSDLTIINTTTATKTQPITVDIVE